MDSQLFECSPSCCSDTPLPPLQFHAISRGDVYTVNESVCTPIYDILRRSNLERTQFVQSHASFHSVCNSQLATKHRDGRPCILMEYYQEPPTQRMGRRVCLVTTYSGQHVSTLPRIFREFSIPVAQHYAVNEESDAHVHSLPPWDRNGSWIIAWVFVTQRPLIDRLRSKSKTGHPRRDVGFGEAAMKYIKKSCKKQRKEWLNKCKDHKFAGPYAKEFFVSTPCRCRRA